ncbi:PAP1, partial [Symbiodinium necroappetens]
MSFTPPEVSKDTASSTAAGTGQNTPTGAASTRSDAKEPARFGITHPITTQEATEAEVLASEMLKQELEIDFPRETAQGLAKREEVLQELQRIISEWISEEGRAQGVEASMSAKIVTVGSYRLGVVQPGSDIDTLCIAPPHVTREAFFTVFLKKLEQNPHVSDCVPIPGAYTPIIKLKLRGVSIDLLFARLVRSLDDGKDLEEAVKDDEVLRDMDDKSVRCINGYRVADRILQLVPNQDAFRETLRFVKCWAK